MFTKFFWSVAVKSIENLINVFFIKTNLRITYLFYIVLWFSPKKNTDMFSSFWVSNLWMAVGNSEGWSVGAGVSQSTHNVTVCKSDHTILPEIISRTHTKTRRRDWQAERSECKTYLPSAVFQHKMRKPEPWVSSTRSSNPGDHTPRTFYIVGVDDQTNMQP